VTARLFYYSKIYDTQATTSTRCICCLLSLFHSLKMNLCLCSEI